MFLDISTVRDIIQETLEDKNLLVVEDDNILYVSDKDTQTTIKLTIEE